MNTNSHHSPVRRGLAVAGATVFVTLINTQAALAQGAVSGTGRGGNGGRGGGGGGTGGGSTPTLVTNVSDGIVAAIGAVALAVVAWFALPPLVKGLKDRNFGAILTTLALAGLVWFFVGDPKAALDDLASIPKDLAK